MIVVLASSFLWTPSQLLSLLSRVSIVLRLHQERQECRLVSRFIMLLVLNRDQNVVFGFSICFIHANTESPLFEAAITFRRTICIQSLALSAVGTLSNLIVSTALFLPFLLSSESPGSSSVAEPSSPGSLSSRPSSSSG